MAGDAYVETTGPGPHRELQARERGQVLGSLNKKEEEGKAENVQVKPGEQQLRVQNKSWRRCDLALIPRLRIE